MIYLGSAVTTPEVKNTAPGLGLAIVSVLLALVQTVLFSREHCACCGAPPAGAALPVVGMAGGNVTHNALKAPQVHVHVQQQQQQQQQGVPALPPNWVRCGPEAGTGDYWYGACEQELEKQQRGGRAARSTQPCRLTLLWPPPLLLAMPPPPPPLRREHGH